MSATHRIRSQRWQVRAPGTVAALAIRQTLRQLQETTVLPVLAAAFDALDDGRVRHLPRLELRLNVAHGARLADELPALLAEAVQQALAELDISGMPVAEGAAQSIPAWGGAASTAELAAPTQESRLFQYLASGQVAWFDAGRPTEDVRAELAQAAAALGAHPEAALGRLLALDEAAPDAVLFRFLQLLDVVELAHWWALAGALAAKSGEAGDPLPGWVASLQSEAICLMRDAALRRLVLSLLLVSAVGSVAAPARQVVERAAAVCAAAPAVSSVPDWPLLAAWLDGRVGVSDTASPSSVRDRPGRESSVRDEAFQISPVFPVHRSESAVGHLALAGLLLLHAWLPRLFAELGWVAERHPHGEPFPPARLPQALALLHWLGTGRDEPAEFELGTAKLLLGIDHDAPWPVAGGLLGEVEKAEGLALLQAVIDHWAALGKTSVAGFRIAFLQRGGLLYAAENGWLLRPQPETYDLLLDRLPWGIGLIRLPWMPRPLHIEWTAT